MIVRLANSLGTPVKPCDDTWNLLVRDLCRQAAASDTVVLRSDPRTCRDLMALRDVLAVLGQLTDAPSVTSGTCLLVAETTLPLAEIALLVARLAGDELGKTWSVHCENPSIYEPPSFTLYPRRLGEVGIEIPQRRDVEIRDLLRFARDTLSGGPQ